MGNRGSKSICYNPNRVAGLCETIVKEQRVDGSYFGLKKYPRLRCTLMAFERNYHIKNLSRQLNYNRLFHSLINENHNKLNPYFVTGFTDAEGYFGTSILKNSKLKVG